MITKQIVQIKNRAQSYGIDPAHEEMLVGSFRRDGTRRTQGLEQVKGVAGRRIVKSLADFAVWSEWLEKVPGIGPAIGGQLVLLYYFRHVPVCPACDADLVDFVCSACGKAAKGNGNLQHRIELRDFPTISSWWKYMGRDVRDGRMPKRRKMQADDAINPNNWSAAGRKLGFDIKESFNKQPVTHKYRAWAEKRKLYREGTHPDATKLHRHNMAWNEAVKLFLSHFWQVAHILDGRELTEPWCVRHGNHDAKSIIPPYYFEAV